MARTIPGSVSTRTQAQKNGESVSVLDFDTTGYANRASGWCFDGTVPSTLDRITGAVTRFTTTVGAVVNLIIQSGGSGYTHATITINGNGSGAAYTATIANGQITGVTLASGGSGYSPATTVAVTGDGTGAVLTAVVSEFPAAGALIYLPGAGASSRTYAGTVYSGGQTSYTTNNWDPNGPTRHTAGPGAFNLTTTIASLADEVVAGTGIYKTAVFASSASCQPPNNGTAQYSFGIDAGPAFEAAVTSGIADLKIPFGCYMVNSSVNLAQMINGEWRFVQRVYSEGPRSPVLIFTEDLQPAFCFQGSFLLTGDPNFMGEVDTCPTIDGLTIYSALCACKFGYFAEDIVTDPISGHVVQAGTLCLAYVDQARVTGCWLYGYYDNFIFDPKRLSQDPSADPLPEELTGIGGVGVFFPKGAACAEDHNFIRNFGICVRTDHASHAISEHSLHYYCGVAWYHQVGPGKDQGGADNCHYSHNKPISWTRAGIFASDATRWLGGPGGGLNLARILNTVFESTFMCAVATAAERAIVDRDGTAGLWIDNCSLPTCYANSQGSACIQLQPVRDIVISNTCYTASLSTSPQVALSPAKYNVTWQTSVYWRDNSQWAAFEFPGVQQGDLDPMLFTPSNQIQWSGGNSGVTTSPGSSWSFVQDPVAGWCTTPAAQNSTYYFFFQKLPTNTPMFYIEVEGIVNEAAGQGLHIGSYDWGYLSVGYYDSTLPSSYASTGLQIATAFLGFTNSGTTQKKRIYIQIPATQTDPNTHQTYTINPQAQNNPELIVGVVSNYDASAPNYGIRIRSVRLTPIDTTAPPAFLTSSATRVPWKAAIGIPERSPLDQGAAGDGATDDTAAINAAIAAYGYLYLPPGVVFAHSGLTITSGLHIFGGGSLHRLGTGVSITVDGTNSQGAYGCNFEDFSIGQYQGTSAQPVFEFINVVQLRMDGVYAYNSNGPIVSLVGNGSGTGYCEQITISRLYVDGGATDVIQVNSSPTQNNVNSVIVALGTWVNYTGYALNNIGQGSGISLVGNVCVPNSQNGSGGVKGVVVAVGNQGIPNAASFTDVTFAGNMQVQGTSLLEGAATAQNGLTVTGGTSTDTITASGPATLNGSTTLAGPFTHSGVAQTVAITDPTTLANWRAALGITTSAALKSPFDKGAKGDGVTDDTATINSAISSYGYLYVPPGVTFLAASGLTITAGIAVFGGGTIQSTGSGPTLSVDGSSTGGAIGFCANQVTLRRANSSAGPAIQFTNVAQATVNGVAVYNQAGAAVSLIGNGTGFGYCEQVTILELALSGNITDVVQINSTPDANHVNSVTLAFSRLVNYSGKVVNNISPGSSIFLVGNMSVGGSGSVTGAVYCLANVGIGDSVASLTITGTATLSGGAAVTNGLSADSLAVTGSTATFSGGGTQIKLVGQNTHGQLIIDTNVAGAQQSNIVLADNGVYKWQIGKQPDGTFFLYDAANTRNIIWTDASGNLYLAPSAITATFGGKVNLNGGLSDAGTSTFTGPVSISIAQWGQLALKGISGNSGGLTVDADTTSAQSFIQFMNKGSGGWQMGRNGDGTFFLWDATRNHTTICTDSNGNIAMMQAVSLATTLSVSGAATFGAGPSLQVASSVGTLPGQSMALLYGIASSFAGKTVFSTDGTGWKYAISKSQSGTITDLLIVADNGGISIPYTLTCTGAATLNRGLTVANGTKTDSLTVTGGRVTLSTYQALASLSANQAGLGLVTDAAGLCTFNIYSAWNATRLGQGQLNVYGPGSTWMLYAFLTHDGTKVILGSASSSGGDIVIAPQNVEKLRVKVDGTLVAQGQAQLNAGATVTNGLTTDSATVQNGFTHSGVAQPVTISDPTMQANWRAALGITSPPKAQLFSPLDQGAKGDGSTDDTAAINAYGYLYLPPGYTFATASGISLTTGVDIFGGGRINGTAACTGPVVSVDGTSTNGAIGLLIEDVTICRYGSTAGAVILLTNVANGVVKTVMSYNTNGPIVQLIGNGSGFGYCEHITIDKILMPWGSCTNGVQITSSPGAWNVSYVMVTNCQFISYSGYAVANTNASEVFMMGCICVPNTAGNGVSGTVTCIGNAGVADNT